MTLKALLRGLIIAGIGLALAGCACPKHAVEPCAAPPAAVQAETPPPPVEAPAPRQPRN